MDDKIVHIEQELRSLIGKDPGFTCPKSYLDELEKEILAKSIEHFLTKTEGYGVPDNYFETIEQGVFSKLDKKETNVISMKSSFIRIVSVAAMCIIAIFLGLNLTDQEDDELNQDEIFSWIESDITSIDQVDLFFAFEEFEIEDENLLTHSIPEKEIEKFLTEGDLTNLINDIN